MGNRFFFALAAFVIYGLFALRMSEKPPLVRLQQCSNKSCSH